MLNTNNVGPTKPKVSIPKPKGREARKRTRFMKGALSGVMFVFSLLAISCSSFKSQPEEVRSSSTQQTQSENVPQEKTDSTDQPSLPPPSPSEPEGGFKPHLELGILNKKTNPELSIHFSPSSLALGGHHSCLLNSDGKIRCAGLNDHGQLGNGSALNSLVPSSVLLEEEVKQIAAGDYHTCALIKNYEMVRCWGLNQFGQLGDGTSGNKRSEPKLVVE